MQVILRESIEKLGQAGEIIAVKNGYGRNYLIPRGLAYAASAANKKRVAAEAHARGQRIVALKEDAEALAAKLTAEDLNFEVKVGEGDKLFGSITSADIAWKLAERGVSVDKRDIELAEPIKMIGVYKVPVRLHPEVRPELRVWVVRP